MKAVFSSQGSRIVVKNRFQLPQGVTQKDIPKWFMLAAGAIQSGNWHVTTAASSVSQDRLYPNEKLQGDFEPGDSPVWGPKNEEVLLGETIPSLRAADNPGLRKMLDEKAGGKSNPLLRLPATDERPAQGLIVVANRFRSPIDPGREVGRSDDAVLETLFHELAAHAGLISVGRSEGHSGDNWLSRPITETDDLSVDVYKFFSVQSEGETIKEVIPAVKATPPTIWQQAVRGHAATKPPPEKMHKDTVWQQARTAANSP